MTHKKRKLSEFNCKEKLLDYVTDRLDSHEREEVEEALREYPGAQQELFCVKSALHYCGQIKKIEISPAVIQSMNETKPLYQFVHQQIKNLPAIVKWSAQAAVLAFVIGILVQHVPLPRLPGIGQKLTLSEVKNVASLASIPVAAPSTSTTLHSAHLAAAGSSVVTAPSSASVSPTSLPSASAGTAAGSVAVTSTPSTSPTKPPPTTAVPATAVSSTTTLLANTAKKTEPLANDEASGDTGGSEKRIGIVYRLFMSSSKFAEVTPIIVQRIRSLGGEKAGEVELGWRKTNQSYFHFVLPEVNYETLLRDLRGYSPVRIHKDPHRRVMPAGQIRIILVLEGTSSDSANIQKGKENTATENDKASEATKEDDSSRGETKDPGSTSGADAGSSSNETEGGGSGQ